MNRSPDSRRPTCPRDCRQGQRTPRDLHHVSSCIPTAGLRVFLYFHQFRLPPLGSRPYRTRDDQGRNNLVLGLPALGEGWHSNHHVFPTSARQGLRWSQVHASCWAIQMLAALKLASKVRVPAAEALVTKRPG